MSDSWWESWEKSRYRRKEQQRQERKEQKRLENREKHFKETEAFQKSFEESFGVAKGVEKQFDSKGSDFHSKEAKEAYRQEVTDRYSYLYNGDSSHEAPSLNRGLGQAHHQKVHRDPTVRHHAPLGSLARKLRTSIVPDSLLQKKSSRDDSSDDGRGFGSSGSAAGGKLNRPF